MTARHPITRNAVAERLCKELSIPEGHRVAALIMKTKTHDAGDDADAQVLLDADLAILGASEPAYLDYAKKIRQEYAWVPEPEYRQGRRRVLESFLSRPAEARANAAALHHSWLFRSGATRCRRWNCDNELSPAVLPAVSYRDVRRW